MGLAKHSIQLFAMKVCMFMLILATSVVNNRTLGPVGKGQYAIALLVTATLSMITGMGLSVAFQYYINKRHEPAAKFIGFSVIIAFIWGGFLCFLVWISKGYLQSNILRHIPDHLLLIALGTVPFSTLATNLLASIIMARLRVTQYSIVILTQGLILFILAIVLVLRMKLGVLGAVCGYSLSVAVAAIIALAWTIHYEGISFNLRGGFLRQTLGYSWKSFLSNVAMQLQYRLDFYMINFLLTSSAFVGLYSVGTQFCELLFYIPESVRGTMLSRISANSEYGNKTTAIACKQVVIMTTCAGILMSIVARPLIILMYGKVFAEAVYPFMLLLPGVIILSVCNVIYVDLAGRGKPEYTTISSAVGLGLTIILDLLLIPVLGINGAAIASSLAYTGSAIMAMNFFSRLSGQSRWAPIAIGRQDVGIAAGYIIKIINKIEPKRLSATHRIH